MNSITLIGRTTADLERKITNSGKSVCTFSLAVKRPFTRDTTDFINCTVWDKRADTMCQYVHKGQLIGITGYLATRKFTDKNGNNRVAYEVNVNDFDFCESKKSADVGVDPLNDFQNKMQSAGVAKSQTQNDDIFDDSADLPF